MSEKLERTGTKGGGGKDDGWRDFLSPGSRRNEMKGLGRARVEDRLHRIIHVVRSCLDFSVTPRSEGNETLSG